MPENTFILGEFRRTIDDRFRLSLPSELVEPLLGQQKECVIAKERPGAISVWNSKDWQDKLTTDVSAIEAIMQTGRFQGRMGEVQSLGRLLSTRHKEVQLAGRGRLLMPEGFREFLGVDAGGEVLIVGAAVCVEVWRPDAWLDYLQENIPQFPQIVSNLLGQ